MVSSKSKERYVYALWHIHRISKHDDEGKLIGVFEKRIEAKGLIPKLRKKPGFKKFPRGFKIFKYRLGQISWDEGFITVKC